MNCNAVLFNLAMTHGFAHPVRMDAGMSHDETLGRKIVRSFVRLFLFTDGASFRMASHALRELPEWASLSLAGREFVYRRGLPIPFKCGSARLPWGVKIAYIGWSFLSFLLVFFIFFLPGHAFLFWLPCYIFLRFLVDSVMGYGVVVMQRQEIAQFIREHEKEIRYVERGSIPRIHEATSVTYPPMIRSLWRTKPNVPPKR
jgi:hypothetical protein